MNMLRMAATGEIEANISQSRPNTRNSATQCLQRPDKMASSTTFPQDFQQAEDTIAATQLRSTLPFKVPEHDTIIRSAHSRLASSQGNRPGSAFHQTLQQELDQQTERLYSHLRSRSTKGRPRSSSLASRPVSTDLFSQHPLSRGRTYSWTTGLRNEPLLPPPPVKVRVTKKMLNTTPSPSKTQDHYLPQWINSQ